MNNITTTTLHDLATKSCYDYHNKQEFRKKSLSFLRKLAKILGLQKGEYEIRFNAGGDAVCGDPILHHKKFYVNLASFGRMGGYWRECDGLKDYCGKWNRPVDSDLTVEQFAKEIDSVINQ